MGNEPSGKLNDPKILVALNNEKNSIKREIVTGLQIELTQFLPIEYPGVDINFENENALATGIVVIDFGRKSSGAIALSEYTNRLVKRVTENAIKNVLKVKDVMTQKDAILSTLTSDTIRISSDISLLKTRNNRLGLNIESLNKEISKNQQSINEINSTIIKLHYNKTKFSCKETWNFMDRTLKNIVITVFVIIILSIFSIIFPFFRL